MRRTRGYTLIELILVIGILGLAGALLVPVLGDRGDFDTQAAVRRLVADITFAQSDALANQEPRRVVFLPDPEAEGQFLGWCIVKVRESDLANEYDPETANYVSDPLAPKGANGNYIVDIVGDERFGESYIASADLDGGSPFITFDELGGTITSGNEPGTGGEIVIRGGNSGYRITVDGVTGKLTVTDITLETPELETGGGSITLPGAG
jgi:prepilin-type N-terminal cleavage/methylation domain-containing protein